MTFVRNCRSTLQYLQAFYDNAAEQGNAVLVMIG